MEPDLGPGPQPEVVPAWRLLRSGQGPFAPKPVRPAVDELIATVLSQATSDRNSERAFAELKAAFPDWDAVLAAPPDAVADAIRGGGIAERKSRRIQQILAAIAAREGRIDLCRLDDLDDPAAQAYLTSLPGVGPKTAACVLVFAMGRPAFPVDTRVHRIATRLGWIPSGTTAERAFGLLTRAVPPELRYDLHLALIEHGRTVCTARRPACGGCVLRDLCPWPVRPGPFGLSGPRRRRPRTVLCGLSGPRRRRPARSSAGRWHHRPQWRGRRRVRGEVAGGARRRA